MLVPSLTAKLTDPGPPITSLITLESGWKPKLWDCVL